MKCNYCGAEQSDANAKCEFCSYDFSQPMVETVETEKKTPTQSAQKIIDSIPLMEANNLLKMGKAFYAGVGFEKDTQASYKLFYAAASKGVPEAMFYLAKQLEDGDGVEQDVERALWWYIQSSKLGCKEASIYLSEMSFTNIPFTKGEDAYQENGALKDAVLKVCRFCVEIAASSGNSGAYGSGCIISPEYVLTNHHVVVDKSTGKPYKNITLKFHSSVGNDKKHKIKVELLDEAEDIAVCSFADGLKVRDEEFPRLGNAHGLKWGDEVFTVGNALGRGLALSAGVVAKDIERNYGGKAEVLQTDMSINGGNSGGALFNLNGEIVGLMTFVPLDDSGKMAHGMSYAITSNTILKNFK